MTMLRRRGAGALPQGAWAVRLGFIRQLEIRQLERINNGRSDSAGAFPAYAATCPRVAAGKFESFCGIFSLPAGGTFDKYLT
jgi:hypothetical protein